MFKKQFDMVRSFAARRSKRYWTTALVILIFATWARPFFDSRLELLDVKSWMFQHLSAAAVNPARPHEVKLVLIKDDEYWDGPLHHRVPTDRRYLAKLLMALDRAEVASIGLDFDLRMPDPHASGLPGHYDDVDEFEPYRLETDDLVRAIDAIARKRNIVLSKSILGPDDGPFTLRPDVYQAYGLYTKLRADGMWENPGTKEFALAPEAQGRISCGYIALMADKRLVPPPDQIKDEKFRLYAFPVAIAATRIGDIATDLASGPHYASFIPKDLLNDPSVVVSAHDLLNNFAKVQPILQGYPVIIGAAWNQRAKGSGELVDIHDTPVGKMFGAILHANLVEALLTNRVYRGFSEHTILALEIAIGLAAGIFFAAFEPWWQRGLALMFAVALLVLLQWLVLQLFGFFLDAFIPIFGLGLHAMADRLVGDTPAEHP